MKPTIRLVFTTFALALTACGHLSSPSSTSLADEGEGIAQTRVHTTFVAFTKWHDTMQIDAGLTRDGATCKILNPLVVDATTKWAPFQIYWGIRDDESDADLGTELHDTFFVGDVSRASEFPGVLGFAALNPDYAHLLALEGIALSADRSTVVATIGSPFNAKLRIRATPSGDGCTSGTTYCKTSGDCSADSSFRPLTSILVKQNFLGYPTEVIYN